MPGRGVSGTSKAIQVGLATAKSLRIIAIILLVLAGRLGSASGQTLTTLYQFGGGTNGEYPGGALVQGSDGYYYGTTNEGGDCTNYPFGCGTVFRISSAGTLTTLYQFSGNTGEGYLPQAGVVQGSDGYFYGTAPVGGTTNYNSSCGCAGYGTVFRISSAGTLTTLYIR